LHEEEGWKRYCKSVHSNTLLSSEETKMVAKIILLGMEIVVTYGNIFYVESCKKEKKLQINEPYQVQATAGHGPCRGFP
jgi:hypothetical protein